MITIELGDFRDYKCPDNTIACIVDPPFNIGKNYNGFKFNYPYEEWVKDILNWSRAPWTLIFGPWTTIYEWLPRVPKPDRILVWHKTFIQHQTVDSWSYSLNPILIYKKDGAVWCGPDKADREWHDCIDAHSAMGDIQTMERYFPRDRPKHPGMTGTAISTKLIEAVSKPRDLIVDPMCGMGTIPLSALRLGREAWGCEINPEYRNFALEWIYKEGLSSSLYDYQELTIKGEC